MNRPPNPNRDEHRRLRSEGNAAAGRGDYAECRRLWNAAATLKAEGVELLSEPVTVISIALYGIDHDDGRLVEVDDMVDRWAEDSGIRMAIGRATFRV